MTKSTTRILNVDNNNFVSELNEFLPIGEYELNRRALRSLIYQAYNTKSKQRIRSLKNKSSYRRSKN